MSTRTIALITALGALMLPGTAHATITAKRAADGAVTLVGATSAPAAIAIAGVSGKTRVTGSAVQPGTGCSKAGTVVECGDDAPRRVDVLLAGSTGKLTIDYAATSLGNAPGWLEGGSGDDDLETIGSARVTFRGRLGQDTLTGGAGDDQFFAEPGPDGADVINGRGDGLGFKAGSSGDMVSYGFRTAPVVVTLPADNVGAPTGANGSAGEGDKLAHLESVDGGSGDDWLLGNERGNRLYGHTGADTVDGGPGNDRVELRRGAFSGNVPDVDLTVACGDGEDVLWRDFDDPIATDCEHDAPGVRGVDITGELAVGSTVAAAVDAYGDPGVASYQWMSCATETDCEVLAGATGATLVIPPTAEGRHLQVRLALAPQGFEATTELERSPVRGPVAAAVPPVTVPTETPVPTVTPAPTPPAKTFADEAAELATAGLGAGARFSAGLKAGGGARVFLSPAVKDGALRLSRKGRAVVAGVVCPAACTVKAEPSVRVAGRTTRLRTTRTPLAGRRLGTVSVALSPAQLRAVRRAAKPKLTLRLSVGGVSAAQRFRLQLPR